MMSYETEDLMSVRTSNKLQCKKNKNLSEKIFSIENLLNTGSRKVDVQNDIGLGMSTLGSPDIEHKSDSDAKSNEDDDASISNAPSNIIISTNILS